MSKIVKMIYINESPLLLRNGNFSTCKPTYPPFLRHKTLNLPCLDLKTVDNSVNKVDNIKGCVSLHNTSFFQKLVHYFRTETDIVAACFANGFSKGFAALLSLSAII